MYTCTVGANAAGMRLDRYLAQALEVSRERVQAAVDAGSVRVNSGIARSSYRLRIGDVIEAELPALEPIRAVPQQIPLSVVYEDDHILVVNKPRGMVVHPAPGNPEGTLVNALLGRTHFAPTFADALRPGIVHRLDKDTSGLLVVAKTEEAYQSLQLQIAQRTAQRIYLAVVWGNPSFRRVEVDAPIGRHPVDRKKMAVITDAGLRARSAVTQLEVVEAWRGFSLVEARLRTGRTHQIRVHCAYIGHPVVGDLLYGGRRRIPRNLFGEEAASLLEREIASLHGQALHAYRLAFRHPSTGDTVSFHADPPQEMARLIERIRAASREVS
ncbi:MAG: RluA family pseudouridine synthase [Chthonomonadales bacterium]